MSEESKLEFNLKVALENRAFEIQMFWQRSNYFLVLITALGIGVYTSSNHFVSGLIAVVAGLASFLWFRTNLGSKFWQESWEVEVSMLSKEYGLDGFNRSMEDIRNQVIKSLRDTGPTFKKDPFRKWIDTLTIKKYSVTHSMIVLSFLSMIGWFLLSILFFYLGIAGISEVQVPPSTPK